MRLPVSAAKWNGKGLVSAHVQTAKPGQQRSNFRPLKTPQPSGDLYSTLQVKPSFCLQDEGGWGVKKIWKKSKNRKRKIIISKKRSRHPDLWPCSSVPRVQWGSPEVSEVFGCVFLAVSGVIVSTVCWGQAGNIALMCALVERGMDRLRQSPSPAAA